jgi:putative addiction module component (TIGR02574 family)
MTTDIEAILKLPVDERLEIIERICESLDENVPSSEYEVMVAKERFEEYQKNPKDSLDWKEVKNQLFHKYGMDNQD